jgi:hypothetical protein
MICLSGQVSFAENDEDGNPNPAIKCVPVKRPGQQSHQSDRGIAIYYELAILNGKGQVENTVTKFSQKLWFGENLLVRNYALNACERGRRILECRQDGPEHTSYFRGGASTKSRLWALHGPNIYETFSDPTFWGDSAFLQCQKRIIDHIAGMIQQLQ